MGERCEITLDKQVYRPGETIAGKVECHFTSENKVRAIRVRFRGRTKVSWKEGRNITHRAEEVYFEMETNLLLCETTFPPGVHSYPFTFNLPNLLPSSMDEMYGSIRYSVKAIIDKPWAIDYECKKIFKVISYKDLDTIENIMRPTEFSVEKRPFSLLDDSKPIKLTVNMPISGYVPSQMISFSAKVKNDSDVNVDGVRFKLAQGFVFHVKNNITSIDSLVGQEYGIVDSRVPSKSEKSWDLELRVPHNMFNGNLNFCNYIDVVWELRGEVCLPFPYNNFKIVVPFYLGAVPLPGTSIF